MKVCIVTVYNSINSGSFWQAFSLAQVLAKMGYDVSFYERDMSQGGSNSIKQQTIKGLKILFRKGIFAAQRYCQSVWKFKKALRYLKVIRKKSEGLKEIDCFILGSDTIWNFADDHFYNNYEIYLGKIFSPHKVITYAASAANTTQKDCLKIPELKKIVTEWSAIGVRDENTKLLLEKMTDTDIRVVCDPVFLLLKKDYSKWIKEISDEGYIFLYLFEKLSNVQIIELRTWADEKGLLVINGASVEKPWYCDKTIINSPFIFLSYMFYAAYVVTDTYHGTAFSIIFNKNFCVVDRGKKKVEDLLMRMNITDRIVNEKENIIPVICNKLKDWEGNVGTFRDTSIEYLNMALGNDSETN